MDRKRQRKLQEAGWMGLQGSRIDAVSGRGDVFAFAARAAARLRQLPAIAEHIPAVRTSRGFEDEAAGAVPCDRLGDVVEMVFDLAFRNAEHLRQLIWRQPGVGQELDDALARRAF